MGAEITEPQIIERGPYLIVGAFADSKDGDEPWGEASEELDRRKGEIQGRVSDELIGFLYRPHRDNPAVPENVRGCFMGVEVKDLDHVPEGMYTTRFSGGRTAIVHVYTNQKTPYAATVTTNKETTHIPVDSSRIFLNTASAILDMFDTRKPSIDRKESLIIRRILDIAGKKRARKEFVNL